MPKPTQPRVDAAQLHARYYLWALLEALADDSNLVLGATRTGVVIVLIDKAGKQTRVKGKDWEEGLRRLATKLSIEVVCR